MTTETTQRGVTKFGEVVVTDQGIKVQNFTFNGIGGAEAQIAALWWAYGEIQESLRKLGQNP